MVGIFLKWSFICIWENLLIGIFFTYFSFIVVVKCDWLRYEYENLRFFSFLFTRSNFIVMIMLVPRSGFGSSLFSRCIHMKTQSFAHLSELYSGRIFFKTAEGMVCVFSLFVCAALHRETLVFCSIWKFNWIPGTCMECLVVFRIKLIWGSFHSHMVPNVHICRNLNCSAISSLSYFVYTILGKYLPEMTLFWYGLDTLEM